MKEQPSLESGLVLSFNTNPNPSRPQQFATTQWSMVVRATDDEDSKVAQIALAELCQQYWYPLYCFARSKVSNQEDAADIVQGFFLQLLEKSSLQLADKERGRFRNFLLASISNFLKNHRRDAQTLKRGGGLKHFSFDFEKADQKYRLEPVDQLTPEKIFERSWALELIDRCLHKLKDQYQDKGKADLFDSLCDTLQGGDVSYGEIAASLGMNPNAVKVAAHRMRQSLGVLIRAEVANTVEDPAEIEVELQHLMNAMHE